MALYQLGRALPVYGVDLAAYDTIGTGEGDLILQTVGGDRFRTSVFALGISPFMISTLFVQLAAALKNANSNSPVSPKKLKKLTYVVMFLWAIVQAWFTTASAIYLVDAAPRLSLVRLISGVEMVAGAFVILWLGAVNTKHGIGGYTLLIFVNVLESVIRSVKGVAPAQLKTVGLIACAAFLCTVLFENAEYRIPLQRISIHNIYSDKNYIPIKLNPIGMMPVMFSSAFFLLPIYACRLLATLLPDNGSVIRAAENMDTTHPLGIGVYVAVLFIISVSFSFVFLSPKTLAEHLQKSGDSITGLRSGRRTRSYISRRVLIISLFSAGFLAFFIALPLVLQLKGLISLSVMNLPSVMIVLGSISCSLYRELRAARDQDAYIPFI